MKRNKLLPIGIVLGLLLIIYFGFAIFFGSHYLFRTTVGSVKCALKTPAYVIEKNSEIAEDYLLTIYDRNNEKFHLAGHDFDYKYVPVGVEEMILDSQNQWAWPVSIFKASHYDLSTSVDYNKETYEKQLDKLGFFSEDYIVKPEDAKIKITDTGYELVDEVMGCEPVRERIDAIVTEALDNQCTEITLGDDCYVSPLFYADDRKVAEATALIDKYMQASIHYEIDDADENIKLDTILKMIKVDPEFNVSLAEGPAMDFVQHLATTYNTYADVREFKTTKGDTIKIGGGDYGWVISKSKELAQVLADIEAGQPVSREPVYEQRAMKSGLEDIGNTYVEIDYTNQHLWYYEDGQLIDETDIVSGCLANQNGSVDGVFKIAYKERNATLVGEDYSSEVNYFMPFAYNIGIHDANWRSSFGKDIYKTSGSHGCINVPPNKAKDLFKVVATGTPVVAYYREKVELTNEAARISNAYSYVEKKDDEKADGQ